MDELYLENLDEYINDENKIVTYKWLSRSLGVHVNQAKQMLFSFVQQQRNNKDNDAISVTYLLAGTLKKSDDPDLISQKVSIVPEERLEAAKTRFSVVTSCHIYSAQKSQLKDSNALYSVDYDQLQENVLGSNKYSAITCTTSKVRTDKELKEMRSGGGDAYAPSYKAKVSPPGKGSGKSKAASIGSMFNKASKNQTNKATEKKQDNTPKEPEKEVKSKPAEKKPVGGLASAFAKQAAKPKVEKKVEKVEEPKEEAKTEEKPSKKVSPPPSKTLKKSKKNAEDGDDRQSKRRRIKAVESSSEDEEIDIDEVPPTPPREPSPEPEPINVDSEPEEKTEEKLEEEEERGSEGKKSRSPSPVKKSAQKSSSGKKARKQKRRLVQKTSLDEEGFMVTEKVYECYSTDASDEEEEAPAPTKTATKVDTKPKPEQKPAKKKVSPNKNTGSKQTSLMNFFKKK